MEKLTVQDTLDLIDNIVAERGEGFRALPRYVHEGLPMCGVGAVLNLAGISPAVMKTWGATKIDAVASSGALDSLKPGPGVIRVLSAFQEEQDGKNTGWGAAQPGTWGDAREAAHIAAIPFLKSIDNPQADQKLAHV